jgi:hypothetical protein
MDRNGGKDGGRQHAVPKQERQGEQREWSPAPVHTKPADTGRIYSFRSRPSSTISHRCSTRNIWPAPARRAEELGFAALWFRDVPLRDPGFGDIGQVFDSWAYLGWNAAQTRNII